MKDSWQDRFRRKRLVPADDLEVVEPPPMEDIRQSLNLREYRESINHFTGDPQKAAQLMPLARTILGGLIHQLALGRISYGHRIVNLPDGSQIRVIHNSGINRIDIVVPVSVPVRELVQLVLHGFIIYPKHSVDFPYGRTPSTDPNADPDELALMTRGFDYQSDVIDTDGKEITDIACFGDYNVSKEDNAVSYNYGYPVRRLSGNQFFFYGGDVFSWWGSPMGDGPLPFAASESDVRDNYGLYMPFLYYQGYEYDPAQLGNSYTYACLYKTHITGEGGTAVHHLAIVPVGHIYKNGQLYGIVDFRVCGVGVIKSGANNLLYVVAISSEGISYAVSPGDPVTKISKVRRFYRSATSKTQRNVGKSQKSADKLRSGASVGGVEIPGEYQGISLIFPSSFSETSGTEVYDDEHPENPNFSLWHHRFSPTENKVTLVRQDVDYGATLKNMGYAASNYNAVYHIITYEYKELDIEVLGDFHDPEEYVPFYPELASSDRYYVARNESAITTGYSKGQTNIFIATADLQSYDYTSPTLAELQSRIDSNTLNLSETFNTPKTVSAVGKVPLGINYRLNGELVVAWLDINETSEIVYDISVNQERNYGGIETTPYFGKVPNSIRVEYAYGTIVRGTAFGGGVIGTCRGYQLMNSTRTTTTSTKKKVTFNDQVVVSLESFRTDINTEELEERYEVESSWYNSSPGPGYVESLETGAVLDVYLPVEDRTGVHGEIKSIIRNVRYPISYTLKETVADLNFGFRGSRHDVSASSEISNTQLSLRFIDTATCTVFCTTKEDTTSSSSLLSASGVVPNSVLGLNSPSHTYAETTSSESSSSINAQILRYIECINGVSEEVVISQSDSAEVSETSEPTKIFPPIVTFRVRTSPGKKEVVPRGDLPAYGEFLTAPFTYFAADSRFNPDIDWAMAEKLPAGFRDQSNFDWKNPLINDARASFGELLPSDADDVAPIGLF